MPFTKGHKINLGRKFPIERNKKIGLRKLGNKYRLGLTFSEESKEKIRVAKLGVPNSDIAGEKHYRWKGDNIGYHALHIWLRRNLLQPLLCEFCNERESIHIANMTGIYNRDFSNWKYLCGKCHYNYDRSKHPIDRDPITGRFLKKT